MSLRARGAPRDMRRGMPANCAHNIKGGSPRIYLIRVYMEFRVLGFREMTAIYSTCTGKSQTPDESSRWIPQPATRPQDGSPQAVRCLC